MNDLNGLDWSSKPATGQSQKPNVNYPSSSSAFSTLRPTPPVSGRTSPLVNSKSPQPPAKTSPANDSFANLVAFSATKSNKNLSLQEQQKQLAELKAQQVAAQKKSAQNQWTGGDDVWNTLGSGRSTPAVQNQNGTPAVNTVADEEDVFAAFNKPAVTKPPAQTAAQAKPTQSLQLEDDDDPFGLSEFQSKSKTSVQPSGSLLADADDDDFLGDLGRPARERSPPRRQPPPREPSPERVSNHPQDKAVADLVDMGFPADKARRALETTDTGLNVQAAVGWLLNQAHEEAQARQKTRSREPARSVEQEEAPVGRPRPRVADVAPEAPPRERSSTPSGPDFGSTLIKSAGAFWKQAQKQVQQAVSEFNSDSESGSAQPKWMREAAEPKQRARPTRDEETQPRARPAVPKKQADVTDEALMLEAERPTPPPRQVPRTRVPRPDHVFDSSADTSRDHSPAMPSRLRESHSPQPAFMKQQDPLAGMMRPKQPPPTTKQMLNKQAIDDQASQAYVSSARRRKPAAPAPQAPEGDLLEGTSPVSDRAPPRPAQALPVRSAQTAPPRPTQSAPPQSKPRPAAPIVTRPAAPKRVVPSMSPIALKATHTSRVAGNESFKRGDFAAAHEHYTTCLRHIPASHPLQIILLTNRAVTALKTGQPKVAIADADSVITLIGVSKGEGETVDLQDSESQPKPMREYYGKSLMRKAEGLENLERWSDAAVVWRQCVEDGHGGATAIQSRARAERAAAPKPAAKKPPPRAATRSAPPVSAKPAAAVNALRASNAAAEKLDDEKFALADSVSARINAWKNGKEGNLRALLTSLDTVLWEGSGWKKVSMADVVLTNKVKIIYMKGIGKCHPDKVSATVILARCDANPCPASNRRNDRAKDDCGCGVQYAERGLGQVQNGKWSIRIA